MMILPGGFDGPFLVIGDRKYLEAAVKGMRPFSVSSADGGVRAYFMNQHPFYEEYPSEFSMER